MKNKAIIILLLILFLCSTSLGIVGYIQHKKNGPTDKPEEKKELVKFEYYLENEQIENMPKNTEEEKYVFSKYICENGTTINFDQEKWEANIVDEKEDTCKLYFVNGTYEVTLSATNGTIKPDEETSAEFKVDRENDIQIEVNPNEGYEYSDVSCANEKEAVYDLSTNTLTINSIMENTACKINFKIKTLKMELTVKNGKGTATESAKYGESVSAVVQPNDGYEKPKIECTNNQEYTFDNNRITIERLTDNTKCTVTFSKAPIVTYKLKIEDLPEEVIITSGNKEQSIVAGKDGKFTLKPNDGYEVKIDCNGVQPSSEEKDPDGSVAYTFLQMSKDVTCKVTATPSE